MSTNFSKITNPLTLLPILEQRMPSSCFMINQLKFYDKFSHDDLEVYLFGSGTVENNTWILTKYIRADYNEFISISAPPEPEREQVDKIKKTLGSSGIIKWNEKFVFTALALHVSKILMEVQAEMLDIPLSAIPCCVFSMTPEEALQLDTSWPDKNIITAPLEASTGAPFIADNWPYAIADKTRNVVQKCIERLPSCGVYIQEDDSGEQKLICGAIFNGLGLLSMLHTDPNYRRKGYASLCQRRLLKDLANAGLEPCLATELSCKPAVDFHNAFGLKYLGRVFYVRNW